MEENYFEVDAKDLESVAKAIAQQLSRVKKELRTQLKPIIRRINSLDRGSLARRFSNIYSIDSAFPLRSRDLLGASVAMISYGWVHVKQLKLHDYYVSSKVIYNFVEGIDSDEIAFRARMYERTLAMELLNSREDIQLMVFDGELIPFKSLYAREGKWAKLLQTSISLIEKALNRNVPICGVVKRSYSSLLAKVVGLGEIKFNDKALCSILLSRGEYIMLDHPIDLLRRRGCKLVFYKPLRGLPQAVKVEICVKDESQLSSLITLFSMEASYTSLPWFNDLVDSLVKRELSKMDTLSALLQTLLAKGAKDIELALPTNLQEARRGRLYTSSS